MSRYLVLARKYRPRTFGEVVGQEIVTATLRGAIQEGRIGHAYLFAGPRGTGKTTLARIFAKALNCERGPAVDPCGTCERCLAADSGAEIDLIEIDAASNTGVDNVRDLRDQAIYVPLRARFKIYLIDEVHMLSKPAFNALLKTLEEPPAHVVFLFATTELQKIPDTILSRCQVLRLSPLDESIIVDRLEEVFGRENVTAEPGVATEIARRARGGMRDALSLTDQLLSLVGTSPRLADVDRLASEGSERTLDALVTALMAGDKPALLAALPPPEGSESELVSALLDHLRAALVAALCGGDSAVLALPAAERAARAELGKRIGSQRLETWLVELLHLRERMRALPEHARILLEVTLLDLAGGEASVPLADLAERLAALEARLGSAPRSPTTLTPQPAPAVRAEPRGTETSRAPASRSKGSNADKWKSFLAELEARSATLASVLARRGSLRELSNDRAVIRLDDMVAEERTLLREPRNIALCAKAFTAAAGTTIEVELQDAAASPPGNQDAFTREVAELFDGRIEE